MLRPTCKYSVIRQELVEAHSNLGRVLKHAFAYRYLKVVQDEDKSAPGTNRVPA